MYDVNVAYGSVVGDEIGGWFNAPVAGRHYAYQGRMSMVQILHILWPVLERAGEVWQEWYIYQNSYDRDPPNSATMHTRHSLCPGHWMKCIVSPMGFGRDFYHSFWKFVVSPVWHVAFDALNYHTYQVSDIVQDPGLHEWLWPCVAERGPDALYVLMNLIVRTIGTDHRVPMLFSRELLKLYSKWQPMNRM
jgi:hypothetical protein